MSRSPTRALACLLTLGVLSLGSGTAEARRRPRSSPAERAELLNRTGKAAFREGKLDDALTAFQAAWGLHHQPKYLYNVARAHEERGDLDEAMATYHQYLVECPEAEDAARVEGRIDFLRVKADRSQARVEVSSEPSAALLRLVRDDLVIESVTPWEGHLPPGLWTVTVSAPGRTPFEREVAAADGKTTRVAARLEAEPEVADVETEPEAAEVLPAPPAPPPPAEVAAEETDLTPLVVLAGAGAAAVGGVVLGLLATSRGRDLDGYLSDRRAAGHTRADAADLAQTTDRLALAANVSFAAAAVAGVGGALLWQLGPDEAGARLVWTW